MRTKNGGLIVKETAFKWVKIFNPFQPGSTWTNEGTMFRGNVYLPASLSGEDDHLAFLKSRITETPQPSILRRTTVRPRMGGKGKGKPYYRERYYLPANHLACEYPDAAATIQRAEQTVREFSDLTTKKPLFPFGKTDLTEPLPMLGAPQADSCYPQILL